MSALEPQRPRQCPRSTSAWALMQPEALCVWPHHRAAVRAWLVDRHPEQAGIDARAARPRQDVRGKGPGAGDIGRVGALMATLGVRLESDLGRRLIVWAMGKGHGGREAQLHNLSRRILRAMRNLEMVSLLTEEHEIRTYSEPCRDGMTRKYAFRVDFA